LVTLECASLLVNSDFWYRWFCWHLHVFEHITGDCDPRIRDNETMEATVAPVWEITAYADDDYTAGTSETDAPGIDAASVPGQQDTHDI
jgi:hypothetical protein